MEEYWERHADLRNVPIYQASALARRAMPIYQTYIEMMNDDIKAAFQVFQGFTIEVFWAFSYHYKLALQHSHPAERPAYIHHP